MKNWVFFDVMGVIFIVGDDTMDLLVPFVKSLNNDINEDTIVEAYMKASFGQITSKEFWKLVGVEDNYETIEKEYLNSQLIIDEQIIPVFAELSKKYNIGLLSNDVSEWSKFLRKKYCLETYLQEIIISGDVKQRKPSKEIYEIAIQNSGCLPEYCVFIDDRWKNIHAALELGMKVIKFNREDSFDETNDLPQTSEIKKIPVILEEIFAV